MISFKINNVPVLFIKAFNAEDVDLILRFVRDSSHFHKGMSNVVLFIDTPITARTVEAVHKLTDEGYRVVFRDHHGIDGEPSNERDRQVVSAIAKLKKTLGADCNISVRRINPACSALVSAGEFKDAVAVVADPDADGLTAAMKAVGVTYKELDEDAAILDGEPYLQVTGSAVSQLLAKGIATLPSYDPSKPKEREQAHQKLFSTWVKTVQGDVQAREQLEAGVVKYDEAVETSKQLAVTACEVAPGVVLCDVVDNPNFDVGTLTNLLEQRAGCRICVLRKGLGPIAAVHGIQYSLSVAKPYQDTINLQKLLPLHAKSDPELGVISNVPFLLHVSEDVWQGQLLSSLHALV